MKKFTIVGCILSLINIVYTQTDQIKIFNFNEFYLKSVYEVFYFNISKANNFSIECTDSLSSLLTSYGKNPLGWPEKGN